MYQLFRFLPDELMSLGYVFVGNYASAELAHAAASAQDLAYYRIEYSNEALSSVVFETQY